MRPAARALLLPYPWHLNECVSNEFVVTLVYVSVHGRKSKPIEKEILSVHMSQKTEDQPEAKSQRIEKMLQRMEVLQFF